MKQTTWAIKTCFLTDRRAIGLDSAAIRMAATVIRLKRTKLFLALGVLCAQLAVIPDAWGQTRIDRLGTEGGGFLDAKEATFSLARSPKGSAANEGRSGSANERPLVDGKAIFYEQPTKSDAPTKADGTVVWSLTATSAAAPNKSVWPAVHATVEIPDRNLEFELTFFRSTDPRLPVSHVIELIVRAPPGFGGGGIDKWLRVAMKDREEDAGTMLSTLRPAKVNDGWFIAGFGESQDERKSALTLMQTSDWIDLPIVYHSGRRALLTISKGSVGEEVFEGAIRDWIKAQQQ